MGNMVANVCANDRLCINKALGIFFKSDKKKKKKKTSLLLRRVFTAWYAKTGQPQSKFSFSDIIK